MGSLRIDGIQRYKTVAEICSRLGVTDSHSILDVGGGTGGLSGCLAGSSYTTVDPTGGGPGHVTGSMESLPLVEESFDVVVQADSLEHVPKEIRERSLRELVRVAREWIIWIGPVDDELTNRAEEDLCGTHRELFNGAEMGWLVEHRKNGLPNGDLVVDTLAEGCSDWTSWRSCNLMRFWAFMRFNLQLNAGLYRPELAEAINQWYTETGWESDYSVPEGGHAYRLVFVGGKRNRLPEGIEKPPGEEDPLVEWKALVPLMERLAPRSGLTSQGEPGDPETARHLERIVQALTSQDNRKANSGARVLWERLFGGRR
jgi:SAM-dependent methyltransferase